MYRPPCMCVQPVVRRLRLWHVDCCECPQAQGPTGVAGGMKPEGLPPSARSCRLVAYCATARFHQPKVAALASAGRLVSVWVVWDSSQTGFDPWGLTTADPA